MRRTLLILTVAVLALTLTVPAWAKPKQDPPGKTQTNEGTTCAEFYGPGDPRAVGGPGTVVLDKFHREVCFDVPAGGTWEISLGAVPGAIAPNEVPVRLEDSMPGDACYQTSLLPYGGLSYDMPLECPPPDGEAGWTDSHPDLQVLWAYMVGPGRAAVELTLVRTGS